MPNPRRHFLMVASATAVSGPLAQVLRGQTAQGLLIPHKSWDCSLPGGILSPEAGVLVFEAQMKLDRLAKVGKTPYGNRRVAVGLEGKVTGPKLSASIKAGALDFELTLANGVVEVEDLLVLQTEDGKYIYSRSAGVGPNAKDVRVVMDFEAPKGSTAEWLNTGKFVARRVLDERAMTLTLRVYDVAAASAPPASAKNITIAKPAGVTPQPWDFRLKGASEKQGKELIVESVGLSPSQRVGDSKRGMRNIIPITGGDLSGRINGKVLSGGADYQNLSSGPTIDARYLWQAADGEIIIVRNTGGFGAIVPTLEARVDGPYAFLNSGLYLSSNPAVANGGVKITMYDSAN
jgi:hypothetical protein